MKITINKIRNHRREGNKIIIELDNNIELEFRDFNEIIEFANNLLLQGLKAINHKTRSEDEV